MTPFWSEAPLQAISWIAIDARGRGLSARSGVLARLGERSTPVTARKLPPCMERMHSTRLGAEGVRQVNLIGPASKGYVYPPLGIGAAPWRCRSYTPFIEADGSGRMGPADINAGVHKLFTFR